MKTLFIISLLFTAPTWAQQIKRELVRKIVVFPFHSEPEYRSGVEEAWWKAREALTANKRFMVASKDFLERKDVFMSRQQLSPADAIVLGELLDADNIITGQLSGREFSIYSYETERGTLTWSGIKKLNSGQPIASQLVGVAVNLVQMFQSAIPYNGFVVRDELIGYVVYEEGGRALVQVSVGTDFEVEAGSSVQFFTMNASGGDPLFMGGAKLTVFAEGTVVAVNPGILVVQVARATSLNDIKEFTLVRLPEIMNKQEGADSGSSETLRRMSPNYLSQKMREVDRQVEEEKPLYTALAFLGNLIAVLLLAF